MFKFTEMRFKISFKRCRAHNEIMNHVCKVLKEGIFELKREKIFVVNSLIFIRIYFRSIAIQRVNPLTMC